MNTATRMGSAELLKKYVETGRRTPEEISEVIDRMRAQAHNGIPINERPWLSISIPGFMISQCDSSVVFGVMRRVINDEAIREIADLHPETWVDGRWYPADSSGVQLVLVGRITLQNADGIHPRVVELLNVDSDESTIAGQSDENDSPKFLRMSWRMPRRQINN